MISVINLERAHYVLKLALCSALFFTISYGSKKYNFNEDIRITPDIRKQEFINLVYISSSECPDCTNEVNNENVTNIKKSLEYVFDSLQLDLYTVGGR